MIDTSTQRIKLTYAALTHVGNVRGNNQDSYYAGEQDGYTILLVADGMGGHLAGDVASAMAAQMIPERFYKYNATFPDKSRLLMRSVSAANRAIFDKAMQNEDMRDMGTTITCAAIRGGDMILAHVGDSRCYLLSEGELSQISRDHTLVAELVRLGEITEKNARTHSARHAITRALGTEERVDIDMSAHSLKAGDVLLFCTDGLCDHLTDEEIKELLLNEDVDFAASRLVEKALLSGGHDNITVVVARAGAKDE